MSFLSGFSALLLVYLLDFRRERRVYCIGSLGAVLWVGCAAAGGIVFAVQPTATLAAGLLWCGLVSLSLAITLAEFSFGWRRLAGGFVISLALGFGLAGVSQIIGRFSEEEFFVGVQGALLSGWCFIIWVLAAWGRKKFGPLRRHLPWGSFSLRVPGWLFVLPVGFALLFLVHLVTRYQGSFYPQAAPGFSEISEETPFQCGQVAASTATIYEGRQVFDQLFDQMANSSLQGTAEQGMLALLSGDRQWREAFRTSLLAEAKAGQFTGPANSVKYGQYEAALRLYYYAAINQKAPDLFTRAEKEELLAWFAAINRRAMTVEWVDWMYALAFSEWPRGPYLNQEIGAGLLSLLETTGAADPQLIEQNRAFLTAHPFGWQKGFRNTDDALSYQPVWINNAIFQSMLSAEPRSDRSAARRLNAAFEWLLLQARPDGSLTGYNPQLISLASISYLGAELTGSADLLWLAGSSLVYAQNHHLDLLAQPGISGPIDFSGQSPEKGSCLLFADSGLPNQANHFAPDKIVFRSGWQPNDRYLMLNLRFTGWHRYKATNAIVSIYQQEPWIVEQFDGEAASWLPVGRSQFRDKRVPRENLNGLVIGRSGFDALIYDITGWGSAWAQDVPYYANVDRFETGPDQDESVTTLAHWNGWTHTRKIIFLHDGPIVVFDEATGPRDQIAGVTWHALVPAERAAFADNRLRVGPSGLAEMRLLYSAGEVASKPEMAEGQQGLRLLYTSGEKGTLRLITVFLSKDWDGAVVTMLDPEKMKISILHNGQERMLAFRE